MTATEGEIRELYERYGPVLFHRCRQILRNDEDANDAVQETFAKVINKWDEFRGHSSPLTWMYRISTNHCLNQIRNRTGREQKRVQHKDAIVGEGFTRPEAGRWEVSETIRALLADCDDETRQIVTYLFFDEMTREQAAELVGISVPTLRKRLNLFLKKARKRMEEGTLPAGALALLLVVLL
ncbi:MAG TPA: RNA polymerase sigma factor [Myxococcota bacterium]|nr:RNA polymerase sigma factor [Myxococcota bacterium]